MKKNKNKIIYSLILVLAIFSAYLVNTFLYSIVKIEGVSMYPTFNGGEYRLLNKRDKSFSFGKVIVFKHKDKLLVKRVIATEGQRVEIKDGYVFVDGEKKDFDVKVQLKKIKGVFEETEVPKGCLFVLGDNRDNSLDSRNKEIGFIKMEDVLGVLKVSFWDVK
jgi:signal peptidase I